MKNKYQRLISNTAARTRVLGVQMYALGAKGFLHWGYNFYNSQLIIQIELLVHKSLFQR